MKRVSRLEDMVNGWFVGQFSPAAFNTSACEVAVKRYFAGDKESAHYHLKAHEVTVVVSGEVLMCGLKLVPGDIITMAPGEVTSFEAICDSVTVVVKTPGALNDKYSA